MTSPPACPCGDIHELSAATRVAYENITDRGTDKRAYDWARLRDRDGKDVMDYIPLCRRCHVYYDQVETILADMTSAKDAAHA